MIDVVVKVLLVFLILIVSISTISEYICLKTIRIQGRSTREEKIDLFLADLKKTLMAQTEPQENFEPYKVPKEIICEEAVEMDELAPLEALEVPTALPIKKKNIGQILPGFEPSSLAEVSF